MQNSRQQKDSTNESAPKRTLFQQFDELIKESAYLSEKIRHQATTRIKKDNLPPDVFKVSKYGIEILYRLPNGRPYNFTNQKIEQIRSNRKTVGIETVLEYQFSRYRIADALITESNFDGKYISQSKYITGESSLPFFTDTAINAYNANIKGGTIYFTEGEAKAAIMSNYGLEAIGFGGIGMFALNSVLIAYLLLRQPENIVLIYDADYKNLGNKYKYARPTAFFDSAARFLSELKQLFQSENNLPILNICTGKKEYHGKGVDDVLIAHNHTAVTALKSLQSNYLFRIEQINPDTIFQGCSGFFGIMADSRKYSDRIFQGNEGEYFADILNRFSIDNSELKNKLIISPVGSGKSFVQRSMAARERTIIAVPTLALQKDFEREAAKQGIDSYLFNSGKYTSDEKIEKYSFIIVTYKSFHLLVSVLGNNAVLYNLIVDECHNFTSSADINYMHGNLSSILNNLKKFKSYTLFTATDLPVFAPELQIEKWEFIIPTKIKKQIQFFDKGENQCITAAQIAAATAKNGSLPLIVLNNKGKELSKLKRALNPYKTDYQFFNADTKEENHHIELLNTGKVNTNLMIATSVIKEGVNIYNTVEHVVLIIIASPGVPPMHAAEMEQFAARFRFAKSVTLIVLVDEEKIKFNFTFSFANNANIAHQNAVAACNNNNQNEPHEREFFGKLNAKLTQNEAIVYSVLKNQYEFCPLLLANNVFKAESEIQRLNPLLLIKYLQKYNWYCNDATDTDVLIHNAEKLEYQEPEQPGDEPISSIELFNQAMFILENNEPLTSAEREAESGENPFFGLFLDLFKAVEYICSTNSLDAVTFALDILRQTEGKINKVNILKRQISFKQYLALLIAYKETRATREYLKSILNIGLTFSNAKNGLTSYEIRQLYISTVLSTKIADNRDLAVLRNDRILKNLSRFLNYTVKVVKVDSNPKEYNKLIDELKKAKARLNKQVKESNNFNSFCHIVNSVNSVNITAEKQQIKHAEKIAKTKNEIKKTRKELSELNKKVKLYYFETVDWF